MQKIMVSLSARRAWIETRRMTAFCPPGPVALRKESVDRNEDTSGATNRIFRSLSARRAWIETYGRINDISRLMVALRKESVDRN